MEGLSTEVSLSEKVLENIFNLKLKNNEKGNHLMVDLIKLKKELLIWTISQNKCRWRTHHKIWKNGSKKTTMNELLIMNLYQVVIIILKRKVILVCFKKILEKSMPSRSAIFVLSYSKRIMNKFEHEIVGFYSNKVYYQGTDSLYIHMDHHEKLKEAGYVGND